VAGTGFRTTYLRDVLRTFRQQKRLAEAAIAQIADTDVHASLDPEANSIAVIVKHLSGNLRSRFTDFLTTDGEKPDRHRDAEFEAETSLSREQLLGAWETSWALTLGAVEALSEDDLERTVHIRGEAYQVVEALNRAVAHTAYHVGQITLLAKHLAGSRWESLSIPKGKSAEYAVGTYKGGIIPRPRQ
jgi:hypothetical protein